MITDINFVREHLPDIPEDANKYSKGYAVIFAGSPKMAGAAVLCGKACLKSGAGIVRLVVPKEIYPVCAGAFLEAVYSFSEEDVDLSKASAVSFGCGIGQSEEAENILIKLLKENTKPLLIDADGINLLSKHIDILRDVKCPVVLTPHEGEMSRLTGLTSEYIRSNREVVAKDFAEKHGVILLLKGKNTVVASPSGQIMTNPTGSAALATAGSGDVLSGIITALMCSGVKPFEAAVSGAYIHGLSGDFAEKDLGKRCVTASDIIEYLPETFKEC